MSTPISSSTASTGSTSGTSSTSTSGTSGTTSSGTFTPAFQISGLVSGLDTNSIISKLVAVYSAPMQIVQRDEVTISQKQAAWNDIQSKMQALQTAIQNLQAPTAVAGKVGTVTPPAGQTTAPFTVTAAPTAAQGTYAVTVNSLATTASLAGASGIAKPVTVVAATGSPLASENLGMTPSQGKITLNGTAITVDAATTLLGIVGSDSIQAKVNAIAGLAFSYNTDGSGNITNVTVGSTTTPAIPIQLGASSDTSNVLSALHLTSAVPTTTPASAPYTAYAVTSNGALSGIKANVPLASASFKGVFNGSGSFNINGTTITYAATDSLNSLIGQINTSKAGVTATYDPLSDRVTLAANATGTGGINVTDPSSSGLPAALGLITGATSTAGLPASVTISGINGGNPIASASNTLTNAIPGVTLKLQSSAIGGASTVAITADTTTLTTTVQSFVTAYNTVQDTVAKYNAITLDQTGTPQSAGILAGDPGLSSLTTNLDQVLNDTSVAVGGQSYSMAALGISTGVPGSFVTGQTPSLDLQFDSTKLTASLATTPTLAQAFMGNGSASSQAGTLFQNLFKTVESWTSPLGNVGTSLDALSAQYANDQQSIQNWQMQIASEQQQLATMFTAMETSLSTLQAQGQALGSILGYSSTAGTSTSTSTSGH